MTTVKELLQRRSEGWESDPDEAGEGLYYTEKQQRVLKHVVKDMDADLGEIADRASVHPSYVRYIVNRLPKDKANDKEWLAEKANVRKEELEEPPALSKEEAKAREQEEDPPDAMMQSFGLDGEEIEGVEEINEDQELTEDGYKVSMTRLLPVTITVQIPYDTMTGQSMSVVGKPMQAKNEE